LAIGIVPSGTPLFGTPESELAQPNPRTARATGSDAVGAVVGVSGATYDVTGGDANVGAVGTAVVGGVGTTGGGVVVGDAVAALNGVGGSAPAVVRGSGRPGNQNATAAIAMTSHATCW
jgi:hypothetical protein